MSSAGPPCPLLVLGLFGNMRNRPLSQKPGRRRKAALKPGYWVEILPMLTPVCIGYNSPEAGGEAAILTSEQINSEL